MYVKICKHVCKNINKYLLVLNSIKKINKTFIMKNN